MNNLVALKIWKLKSEFEIFVQPKSKLTMPKDNLLFIAQKILKANAAKIANVTLKEKLLTHPDYPSLLSLQETMEYFKLDAAAIKITEDQIKEVPPPFTAHLNQEGGVFAWVTSISDQKVEWEHYDKGKIVEDRSGFFEKWNGVLFFAEVDEETIKSKDKLYVSEKIEKFSIYASIVALLGILTFLIFSNINSSIIFNLFGLGLLIGASASIALLWQTIDPSNEALNKFCSTKSKKNGCVSLTQSNLGNLTQWLSWSEIGFGYFIGSFIFWILPIDVSSKISTLVLCSIAGLPMTTYFIWKQYSLNQWCKLCMVVQIALIGQGLLSVIYVFENFNSTMFSITGVFIEVFMIALALVVWFAFKSFIFNNFRFERMKIDLMRYQGNPDIALYLLEKQPKMPELPFDIEPVLIGNSNASHTITMVTNPYCKPCSFAHKAIEKYIENNSNLNCQVIFFATNETDDKRGTVARSVFSLPKNEQAMALSKWYNQTELNIEKWQAEVGVNQNQDTNKTIEDQFNWCLGANIESTPSIFLNGYKLPDVQRLEDFGTYLNLTPNSIES